MSEWLFDRFRELDHLVLSEEVDHRQVAHKRAKERPQAPPLPRVKVFGKAPSKLPHLNPSIMRMFVPAEVELFELESLREQHFVLQSEISDMLSELGPLRQKMEDIDEKQADIVSAKNDHWFTTHNRQTIEKLNRAQHDARFKWRIWSISAHELPGRDCIGYRGK
jgi:serine/threonine protein phosphatase PrpC